MAKTNLTEAIQILADMDLYAAEAILNLAEVKITNNPKNTTAWIIKRESKISIEIDESWIDQPAYRLAAVLLHELMHYNSEHVNKKQLSNKKLQNVAQDALINASIEKMNPELGKFFKEFYSADNLGECFLRSDSRPPTVEAARVWQELYSNTLDEEELYDYLDALNVVPEEIPQMGGGTEEMEEDEDNDEEIETDGDQEEEGEGEEQENKGGGQEEIEELWGALSREILEQAPNKIEKTKNQFKDKPELEEHLSGKLEKEATKRLSEEINQEIRQQVWQPLETSRKDLIKVMAGIEPLLWEAPRPSVQESSLVMYVDVSRSTRRYVRRLYGLCVHFVDLLDHQLYCFASDITSVTISSLQEGIPVGKGSDINKALSHALQHRFKRVIMMTDGDFVISSEVEAALTQAGMELFVILTPVGEEQPFEGIAKKIWKMEF